MDMVQKWKASFFFKEMTRSFEHGDLGEMECVHTGLGEVNSWSVVFC